MWFIRYIQTFVPSAVGARRLAERRTREALHAWRARASLVAECRRRGALHRRRAADQALQDSFLAWHEAAAPSELHAQQAKPLSLRFSVSLGKPSAQVWMTSDACITIRCSTPSNPKP